MNSAKPLVPTSEKLSNASAERPDCQKCGLFNNCSTPFLRPHVPPGWTKKLLLIGEAPGEDEDERSGRPFTGPAGKLLRRLWREAGYQDIDVALANTVRCRPKNNATPSMRQVRACRPFLLRVIEQIRPENIVGLGSTAARAITNRGTATVTDLRGRLLEVQSLSEACRGTDLLEVQRVRELADKGCLDGPDDSHDSVRPVPDLGLEGTSGGPSPESLYTPKCWITYHPAAILHGATHLKQRILEDLKRPSWSHLSWPEVVVPVGKTISVDTEFAPPPACNLLTVGMSDGARAFAEEGVFIQSAKALAAARYLAGYSLPGDITKLLEAEFPLRDEWLEGRDCYDGLLLARMYDENALSYELEDLLSSFTSVEPWKFETEAYNWVQEVNENGRKIRRRDVDARRWPVDLRVKRCRLDAWAHHQIASKFFKLLSSRPLIEFTHRTAAALERINIAGSIVDMAVFDELDRTLSLELTQARDLLTKEAGVLGMEGFSATNDGHLRELLYSRLGLPILGRTPGGQPSVAQQTLAGLPDHAIVRLLRQFNHADKLYSVNVSGVRDLLAPIANGYIPLSYLPFRINPLGARTGRRSSTNPNSQNWPEAVRGIVTSRWPGGTILNADYKKLEVVLIAWISGDDKLLAYFTKGKGYIDVARELLGYDVKSGTPEYRAIKSIVLGVHYNMQSLKMAGQLWILGIRFSADYDAHVEETDRLRKLYLRRFPGIKTFMERQEQHWLRTGTSVSYTGRVRHLPVPERGRGTGFGHMLNQAINFPIQELASSVTASAILDVEHELSEGNIRQYYQGLIEQRRKLLTQGWSHGIIYPQSQIFNECHDSLVIDMYPDNLKRDTEIIVELMRTVPSLRKLAPGFDHTILDVEVETGSHWRTK